MPETDILLSVGLDPRDAIKESKDLGKEVEKAFKSGSGKSNARLSALETQLKQSTKAAEELSKKLNEVAEKKLPTKEYQEIQKQIDQDTKALDRLAKRIQEFRDTGGDTKSDRFHKMAYQAEQLRDSIEYAKSDLKDLEETGKAFTLGRDTEEYQKINEQLEKQNDKTKVGLIRFREMTSETDKTSKNIQKASKFTSLFHSFTGQIKDGFQNVAGFAKRMESTLKRGAIRILGMVVGVRSLFALVNKLRSSIREGFNYLVEGDKTLKKQIDGLKDSTAQLKANLTAAFLPIIQMAIPYIQQLISWVDTLISKLAGVMAAVAGQNAYTKAIKKTGEAAGSASKQLSKLDKLNNLTSEGGSGSDWITEMVPVAEEMKELAEMFKSGDWFDIGRGLADKIENFLNSIDWGKIKASARKFATRLATFLNGFFKPSMFYSVGKTLAEGLNTGIAFALQFGKDFDFKNAGYSISEAIRGFFENFNWEDLADTINVWVQGFADLLTGFFSNKEMWKSIFKGLYDFFSNIELETVMLLAAPGLVVTLGKALKNKIAAAFSEQALTGVTVSNAGSIVGGAAGVSMKTQATTAIGATGGASVLGSIGAAVATFAGIYTLVNGLGQSLAMILPGGKFMGLDEDEWAAANPLYKIFDKDKFDGFFQEFFDNIGLDKLILWIEDGGIYGSANRLGQKIGENIGEGLIVIKDKVEEIKENVKTKFTEMKDNAVTTATDVKTSIEEKVDAFKLKIQGDIQVVKDFFTDLRTTLTTKISEFYTDIVDTYFNPTTWASNLVVISDAFGVAFKAAANIAISAINSMIEAIETLVNSAAIGGLNTLIGAANLLPNVNIPTISTNLSLPRIPALAQGTVIPPTMGKFIAELGDNRKETEVVSPLSTMKQALVEAMQEMNFGGEITVNLVVDGRVLAKTVVEQNEISKKSNGGRGLFA